MGLENDLLNKYGIERRGGNIPAFKNGLLAGNVGRGKTFYVDPGTPGSDSNDGLSPFTALATLAAAVAKCSAGRGDTIVRLPGTETVTAAVALNKAGITIVASDFGGNTQAKFQTVAGASYATGPVLKITQPTTIIGLQFDGRKNTGGTIEMDGALKGTDAYAGGFNRIIGCRFPKTLGAVYGIDIQGGDNNEIIGNEFAGAFTGGVYVNLSTAIHADNLLVKNNTFRNNAAGILHVNNSNNADFLYQENVFVDCTVDINTSNGDGTGTICGNYHDLIVTAAYDTTVATLAAADIECIGEHYKGVAGDIEAILAAVDTEVASILEDTGTTIPGTITTLQGNVTDILADTAELQTDWTNGGRLDLLLDAVQTATGIGSQFVVKKTIANANVIVAAGVDLTGVSAGGEILIERVIAQVSTQMDSAGNAAVLELYTDNVKGSASFATAAESTLTTGAVKVLGSPVCVVLETGKKVIAKATTEDFTSGVVDFYILCRRLVAGASLAAAA